MNLTRRDMWALSQYLYYHRPKSAILLWVMILFFPLFLAWNTWQQGVSLPASVITGILVGAPVSLLVALLPGIAGALGRNSTRHGDRVLRMDPEGIHLYMTGMDTITAWASVTGIVDHKQHIFIMMGDCVLCAVPKRCFATPTDARSFYDQAVQYSRGA